MRGRYPSIGSARGAPSRQRLSNVGLPTTERPSRGAHEPPFTRAVRAALVDGRDLPRLVHSKLRLTNRAQLVSYALARHLIGN